MTEDQLHERRERRRALRHLEAWIDTPMIVLSFVWLGLVIVELMIGGTRLLVGLSTAIWIIFIAEFALRLYLAPDKTQFVGRNWLTVIALIVPALRMFAAFRFVRMVRAARGARLVRVVGTANRGMNALRKSMGRRGLGYVLVLTIGVLSLGAAGMLTLEPAQEVAGGFGSYGDALWWTAMLLTTMGTDFWPRTVEGRILCLLLAVYGFAVWGYITASLATFFVGQEARSERGEVAGSKDLAALAREVALLRRELVDSRRDQVPARTPG